MKCHEATVPLFLSLAVLQHGASRHGCPLLDSCMQPLGRLPLQGRTGKNGRWVVEKSPGSSKNVTVLGVIQYSPCRVLH